MQVYWLEQTSTDVPESREWLSAFEQQRCAQLIVPKRRSDWLLGRWTAKLAVASYMQMGNDLQKLRTVEIRPAASGAPQVFLPNAEAPIAISLSHRGDHAICSIAPPHVRLGCDLEIIERRSEEFIEDYFDDMEKKALEDSTIVSDRELLANLMWSAKECALKALQVGLREDPKAFQVTLLDDWLSYETDGWRPFYVRGEFGQSFYGWWQNSQRLLRTIATDVPSLAPQPLELSRTPLNVLSTVPC